MTTSGSTNFNLTANEIVIEARRKAGIHDDEEPLEAQDLVTGMRAMTMMLKTWQAEGVMAWTKTELTFVLSSGDYTVTFGAGADVTTVPLDISDIQINRGGNDITMFPMSREDYRNLPNKTNPGYPTQFYYQRAISGGTLYIWPAADTDGGTLKIDARRLIFDMDASVDDPDVPQEWLESLVYGLAKRLMENYGLTGTPDYQTVKEEAARTYAVVRGLDIGEGTNSVMVVPAGYNGWS